MKSLYCDCRASIILVGDVVEESIQYIRDMQLPLGLREDHYMRITNLKKIFLRYRFNLIKG